MQRIAIIDIGSNSARLVITHIFKNGSHNMVYNQKESLRLSKKIDSKGNLSPEAFTSTLETMRSFAHMCKLYNTDKIIAVATAAVRSAKNGPELTKVVEKETGITLHIIEGTSEAYISYLGVINTLDVKEGIIFDLGGGSTELILFKDRKIVESVSLSFGVVNMTEMFNTHNSMTYNVHGDFNFFVNSQLSKYPWLKNPDLPLIGVGGTIRTIGKIIQKSKKYYTSKIHNYSFTAQTFKTYFKKLRTTNLEQRRKIQGLSTERSDIILAGSAIINCIIENMGTKKVIVSGCGLREGLFLDYYSKSHNVPLVAENILERSTNNILKLYSQDISHSEHVAELALAMFDQWKPLHKLDKSYRRLLKTAALLHDIGITINYYSHARHSGYMVLNAKLFGLTHQEQFVTAAVAAWHNGVSKNYFKNSPYKELLNPKTMDIINKLSLLLALAESLDYSETSQIKNIDVSIKKKDAILKLHSNDLPSIEIHQLESHKAWFAKAFNAELKIDL